MSNKRDEIWDSQKQVSKQIHDERVAKNPDRIAYAITQFQKHGIRYELKNAEIGHFHCWTKKGRLRQYWAGTGKILNSPKRGIWNLIKTMGH